MSFNRKGSGSEILIKQVDKNVAIPFGYGGLHVSIGDVQSPRVNIT